MGRKDYIPNKDVDFIVWAQNANAYAKDNYERWMVASPETIIGNTLKDFMEKYELTLGVNCRKLDVSKKTAARRTAEKAFRSYIQGFIAKNPLVTDDDRKEMQLGVPDTVPTPVVEPDGIAEAEIIYTGRMQLTVRVKHMDGTAQDVRANYGCRIYYGIYAQGDTPPATGKELRSSMFTRLKKELFKFEPEDSGKVAWFCLRYENSKGKAGQWGPLVSAIIP